MKKAVKKLLTLLLVCFFSIQVIPVTATEISDSSGILSVISTPGASGDTVNVDVVIENNPGINALVVEPVYDASVLELIDIIPGEGPFANAQAALRYVWVNLGGDITDNGLVVTFVFKIIGTDPHGESAVSVLCDSSNKKEETPSIEPVEGNVEIHDEADVVTEAGVAPTCETPGYTEEKYCLACQKVILPKEEIPPLGHDFSKNFTVDLEPTETTPGQKSRHCTRCDEVTEITEIPTYIKGDINNDGVVDTKDLSRLMRYMAGQPALAYRPDLNGDGFVNTKDLTRLMKFLAGYGAEFA